MKRRHQRSPIANIMFKSLYDSDTTTWSPQGRLHQIEYALEAVKQGSACVALRSSTHAVLCAVKRSPSKLASFQKKVVRIDAHLGAAYAGLTSDARVISDWMRTEAMRSKHVYARAIPVARMVASLAEKAQVNTQNYGKRPYGVGFLVIGYDDAVGAQVFEASPDAANFEYMAHAIGARSPSARTYFEKVVDELEHATLDTLILHGLKALRTTLHVSQSQLELEKERDVHKEKLTVENLTIAWVGKGCEFTMVEGEDVKRWLDQIDQSQVLVEDVPEEAMAEVEGTGGAEEFVDASESMQVD